ncbi:DUF5590 domain-containing protein [Streptococcus pneumoniae]
MVLSVLAFSFLYVLETAMSPYRLEKDSGKAIAQKYADLTEVDSFDFFHGKDSYDSFLGKNSKGEKIAVLIQKKNGKIYVYDLDKGISQEDAKTIAKENGANEIDKVTFGYFKDQPIWEVKSSQTYYAITFEGGQLLGKEGI